MDPKKKKKKVIRPGSKKTVVKTSKATIKKAAKKAVKRVAKSVKTKAVKEKAKAGSLNIYDLNAKTLDTIAVDAIFQGEEINTDVIYQTVLMYQAGEREGTAATKDRGHVRGGGKKPWKQKGTGQARHGSRRSPI